MNTKTQEWIMVPFAIGSYSFLLYKMWGWFIVTTLNVPHINYAQSLGLWLFITLFRTVRTSEVKEEYREKEKTPLGRLVIPWVYLLFSYIIHLLQIHVL